MIPRDRIDLLSPAKNAECAIAAILAGADAVYIGAPSFSARSDAGNSFDDIERICDFAHGYGARVNIALNTILTDAELNGALEAAHRLHRCGADALIIQDMGLLVHELPPIPIHASTQCHIDSLKKALFLEAEGFETIVLARELGLDEISKISQKTKARMECFVHGALCVSYSGQCYLSHAIGGRSANRGKCAQPCRLKYELADSEGKTLREPAHYLSLKDMNRSASIGELLDAGISSFKIEGRLKDADYVKNITAHYRKILDHEIEKRGLKRSSYGISRHFFSPSPEKSFNRGFCEYFLHGKSEKISSPKTPKNRGEYIGESAKTLPSGFLCNGKKLSNGDGILIETPDGEIFGTNIQRVEGEKIICGRDCPDIPPFSKIWRNKNILFESEISQNSQRAMPALIHFYEDESAWRVKFAHIESGLSVEEKIEKNKTERAQNFDRSKESILQNLSKLGTSKFFAEKINFEAQSLPFLKISEINAIRRSAIETLEKIIVAAHNSARESKLCRKDAHSDPAYTPPTDFRANILNESALNFYQKRGIKISEKSLEAGTPNEGKELMLTKYCILRELDMCKKKALFPKTFKEPLFLILPNIKLELEFKCAECKMALKKSSV